MSRRTTAIAAVLSVLALGSPLITACANPLADNSFNSGVDKYDQGDYQGSIADYDKAIEINPQKVLTTSLVITKVPLEVITTQRNVGEL